MWIGNYYVNRDIAAILTAIIVLVVLQIMGVSLPYVSVRELLFLALVLLIVKAVYPAGARLVMFIIIHLNGSKQRASESIKRDTFSLVIDIF